MDSIQINEILKTNFSFGGVYSSDGLPYILKPNIIYICNNKCHCSSGEHWLALCGTKNPEVIELFDSFGFEPSYYDFLNNRSGTTYIYSNKQIQSYFTHTCGIYCILYCKAKSLGYSLEDFLKIYKNESLIINDIAAIKYLKDKYQITLGLYNI